MISVVIPAHNEELYIGKCLDSLVHQQTQHLFEVIVVNNNSTDNTESNAKLFVTKLNLRIVNEPSKGRGAARRRGFLEAKGTLILSTDADTIVPNNWIESLTQEIQLRHHEAVTGTCTIADFHPVINRLLRFSQVLHMHIYRILFGHYWLSGFNFAITKNIYEKAGGFAKGLNALEDIDLSFRVSRIISIYFSQKCSVQVSGRRFRNGFFSGAGSYYHSFILYYYSKKEPMMSDIR